MSKLWPNQPAVLCPKPDIFISCVESYLPEKKISNADFVEKSGQTTGVKTRAQWIESRTGIKSRNWVNENQSCSEIASRACIKIIEQHPEQKENIKHLVLATTSGDFPSPPTAPRLQNAIGINGCSVIDLGAACSGFVSGLEVALTKAICFQENVLLVAADIRSKYLDLEDYVTSPLFGDGAVAALVGQKIGNAVNFRIKAITTVADGQFSDLIMVPGGGSAPPVGESKNGKYYLKMYDGAKIFLKAREAFGQGAIDFLGKLGKTIEDIAYYVPHQANALILREVKKDLKIDGDKVIEILEETGNIAGASCGVALHRLILTKKLNDNDLILLAAAGGGGIVSYALLEYRA